MSGRIDADWATLFDQAKGTGRCYFFDALEDVLEAQGRSTTSDKVSDADVANAVALARVMAMASISVAADKIRDGLLR